MASLEDLLAPYKRAQTGTPTTMDWMQNDPVYGSLFPTLDSLASGQRAKSGNPAPPQGSGDLLELFYPGYDPYGGHDSHLHVADTKVLPILKWISRLPGFSVGEHPAFDQVDPVHSTNSHHYSGDAGDINYVGGGRFKSETPALNWLARKIRKRYG